MSAKQEYFDKINNHHEKVYLAAKNQFIYATGIGSVSYKFKNNTVTLNDVLYVPELAANFISISKATSNKMTVLFTNNNAIIQDSKDKSILAEAVKKDNIYFCNIQIDNLQQKLYSTTNWDLNEWHRKFGHLNMQSL